MKPQGAERFWLIDGFEFCSEFRIKTIAVATDFTKTVEIRTFFYPKLDFPASSAPLLKKPASTIKACCRKTCVI